jgi:hypothetical protein
MVPPDSLLSIYGDRAGRRGGGGERIVMASKKGHKPQPKADKVEKTGKIETTDTKILAFVERCANAGDLESLIRNATKLGNTTVAEAAFRKRISLIADVSPGTVEHDFWQTVHAFEYALTMERGKNTRLTRTRQKAAKVGVVQTLRDWSAGPQETEGFRMLLERGMPEFTGEAITLRHPEHFEAQTLDAARERLTVAGVDLNGLR